MGSILNTNRAVPFILKDAPVENHKPMKVVIIGAGFSGIYTTIRSVLFYNLQEFQQFGLVKTDKMPPGSPRDLGILISLFMK